MADLIGETRLDAWLEERAWSRRGEALEREWSFGDFAGALAFVNAVGGLAESQGHHPDITNVHADEPRRGVPLLYWSVSVIAMSES